MPHGNDVTVLRRQQNRRGWVSDKDREKVVTSVDQALETRTLGDRERECHISSSGQKRQQQKGAQWSRQNEDQRKARSTGGLNWDLPERELT